jgi:hypothetical protein
MKDSQLVVRPTKYDAENNRSLKAGMEYELPGFGRKKLGRTTWFESLLPTHSRLGPPL